MQMSGGAVALSASLACGLTRKTGTSYRQTSQSDRWHAQIGWNAHVHAAPLHTLIPVRQTGIVAAAHETAQLPQPSRAGA
jgi:hypothetical protein